MNITFEELKLEHILESNKNELVILKNSVEYYFKLDLKDTYNTAVVFSNGAINREKKTPPVYMRNSWSKEIKSNCIFVDDPTIHNSELSIGWGIGRPDNYYLEEISVILKGILKLLNIQSRNTLYYGSSAGGTMSILLGIKHKDSKVIANNPQMRADKFLSGRTIREIHRTFFSSYDEETFLNDFKERISVPYSISINEYCPRIIYLFNRMAYGDYGIQFKAFIEDMKEYNIGLDSINIIMYNDEKLGHNPISKDKSIAFINTYLYEENLWI